MVGLLSATVQTSIPMGLESNLSMLHVGTLFLVA
jgi:hypothetical protein